MTAALRRTGTQAIGRAMTLLKLLAAGDVRGMRLTDIATLSGLEQSTARRLLKAMISEGMVGQNLVDRRYFLGELARHIGLSAVPGLALREACHPHLERLASLSGATVLLKMRSGPDAVCLDRIEGTMRIGPLTVDVGTRAPLGIGSGAVAILSVLPPEEKRSIMRENATRFIPHGVSESSVRRRVQLCARRGYVTHPALRIPGVRGVAVPIPHGRADSLLSLSIASSEEQLRGPILDDLVRMLRAEAALLSARLANRASLRTLSI